MGTTPEHAVMRRAASPQPWTDGSPSVTSAPLDASVTTKGSRDASAVSAAWARVSPSAGCRAPRRTARSNRATTTGRPPMVAAPVVIAPGVPALRARSGSMATPGL